MSPTSRPTTDDGFRVATRSATAEDLAAAIVALSRRQTGGTSVRRRLFVPNNAALYNGAFSGFVSGCNQARTIGSTTTGLVAQAVLFAQAVDTLIPTDGSLNQSKVDLLTSLVSNVFGDQYPQGLTEAEYGPVAEQVVALYSEAILLLAAIAPVGSGPFEQPGGVGTVIEPYDETAPFQVSGGMAYSPTSVALSEGTALDTDDFAVGLYSVAGGGYSVAFAGGLAGGTASMAFAEGMSLNAYDFAVGTSSVATGGSSVAFAGGQANAAGDFAVGTSSATGAGGGAIAFAGGQTDLGGDFAVGQDSYAAGGYSVAFAGGQTAAAGDFAVGANSAASGGNSVAFGGGSAEDTNDFATGLGTASGGNSAAFGNSVASGEFSAAFGGGNAVLGGDFAVGYSSIANAGNAAAFGGGLAEGPASFAVGVSSLDSSVSIAAGNSSVAFAGGEAFNDYSFAVGGSSLGVSSASADNAVAFAGGSAGGAGSLCVGDLSVAQGDYSVAFCASSAVGEASFAAVSGAYAGADASVALAGGTTGGSQSVAIGLCTVDVSNAMVLGNDGTDDTPIGYVAVNLDGAGSVELTASTLIFNTPTSLTATAGSSGATLPDTPEGFLIATIGGFTALKIPFYQD